MKIECVRVNDSLLMQIPFQRLFAFPFYAKGFVFNGHDFVGKKIDRCERSGISIELAMDTP